MNELFDNLLGMGERIPYSNYTTKYFMCGDGDGDSGGDSGGGAPGVSSDGSPQGSPGGMGGGGAVGGGPNDGSGVGADHGGGSDSGGGFFGGLFGGGTPTGSMTQDEADAALAAADATGAAGATADEGASQAGAPSSAAEAGGSEADTTTMQSDSTGTLGGLAMEVLGWGMMHPLAGWIAGLRYADKHGMLQDPSPVNAPENMPNAGEDAQHGGEGEDRSTNKGTTTQPTQEDKKIVTPTPTTPSLDLFDGDDDWFSELYNFEDNYGFEDMRVTWSKPGKKRKTDIYIPYAFY